MSDTDRVALEGLRLFVRQVVREELAGPATSPARPEGFVGTAEAARRAGVKADTVRAWVARGILPATLIPGARGYKIRGSDLDALLSGQSRGTEPAHPVDLAAERGRRLADSVKNKRGG